MAYNEVDEFGVDHFWVIGLLFLVCIRLPDTLLCAGWSLVCQRGLRRDPAAAADWWVRHPVTWHERIVFPLPGLGPFLGLLIRQDREFGWSRINIVAAQRPAQRRAANWALLEMTTEDLQADSVAALAEVPPKLEWLTSRSRRLAKKEVTLPAELQDAALAFARVGGFVAQSQTLQSRFRQVETLDKARKELDSLRKVLISRQGKLSARLLQRANQWNEVIQAERDRLAALAEAEQEIPQVFRFGNPVREDEAYVFAGRRDLVRELEAVHETVAAGWGTRLLDYLRHLQQHRPKFVLAFVGVRPFHALGREWTARFVSARATRVSFLKPEELRPMLEQPIPEFNLRYRPGTLDQLLALTRGQPFLTQAVAKELVDLLNDEKRKDATLADVERAAQKAMRSGEEYFYNVWDDAEADGQALLAALVRGGPRSRREEAHSPNPEDQSLLTSAPTVAGQESAASFGRDGFHSVPDLPGEKWDAVERVPTGIKSTHARLQAMDVLDAQGRIAVPLFERWVRQRV